MTTKIQISEEPGFTRVVCSGLVQYDLTTEMLRKVARIASKSQKPLVLFDIRDADYRHYHANIIRHTQEGPSLGIDRSFRIAVLGSKGEPMLAFIEDAAVNRGYQTKAFTEESEAVVWLLSAP